MNFTVSCVTLHTQIFIDSICFNGHFPGKAGFAGSQPDSHLQSFVIVSILVDKPSIFMPYF